MMRLCIEPLIKHIVTDGAKTANVRRQMPNNTVEDTYHPHGMHQHVLAPHSLDARNTTLRKYAYAATLITGSQTQNLTAQHATKDAAN